MCGIITALNYLCVQDNVLWSSFWHKILICSIGVEFRVFQKYYNDMIKIIPITTLSCHFVSANIITPSEDEEVLSPVTSTEKTRTLLLKISGPLEAGYTASFYKLLNILEKFGNQDCIDLSSNIRNALLVEKYQGMCMHINYTLCSYIMFIKSSQYY